MQQGRLYVSLTLAGDKTIISQVFVLREDRELFLIRSRT